MNKALPPRSLLWVSLLVFCGACQKHFVKQDAASQGTAAVCRDFPAMRFAVLTDLHYHNPNLGNAGAAFEAYLDSDPKLLKESPEILDAVMDKMAKDTLDFVFVTGDLTKDGERLNHEIVAEKLRLLEQTGKRVYVIPGNHDILNYQAYQYTGDSVKPVVHITPADFRSIYGDFGYSEAIAVDMNSLSYVVEPIPGVWLFGLDACRYDENERNRESVIGGKLRRETVAWVETVLKKAAVEKKAVIGFQHHALLEHFPGQGKHVKTAVVSNGEEASRRFAASGMELIFTGHFHAQDIVMRTFSRGEIMFDVATGSVVTYPCPYRLVNITLAQQLTIRSYFVDSIGSHPFGFREYARDNLHQGFEKIAHPHLNNCLFGGVEAERSASDIADLVIANYQGDEDPRDRHLRPRGCASCFLILMVNELNRGLEKDPDPPDNDLIIDLKTGAWRKK